MTDFKDFLDPLNSPTSIEDLIMGLIVDEQKEDVTKAYLSRLENKKNVERYTASLRDLYDIDYEFLSAIVRENYDLAKQLLKYITDAKTLEKGMKLSANNLEMLKLLNVKDADLLTLSTVLGLAVQYSYGLDIVKYLLQYIKKKSRIMTVGLYNIKEDMKVLDLLESHMERESFQKTLIYTLYEAVKNDNIDGIVSLLDKYKYQYYYTQRYPFNRIYEYVMFYRKWDMLQEFIKHGYLYIFVNFTKTEPAKLDLLSVLDYMIINGWIPTEGDQDRISLLESEKYPDTQLEEPLIGKSDNCIKPYCHTDPIRRKSESLPTRGLSPLPQAQPRLGLRPRPRARGNARSPPPE